MIDTSTQVVDTRNSIQDGRDRVLQNFKVTANNLKSLVVGLFLRSGFDHMRHSLRGMNTSKILNAVFGLRFRYMNKTANNLLRYVFQR